MMTKKPGLLKKIFFFIIQYILEPFDKNDTGIFRLFFIPGTDITLSYYQDTHFKKELVPICKNIALHVSADEITI